MTSRLNDTASSSWAGTSLRQGGEHTRRFHHDPKQHLQAYTCFHGDREPREGEQLLLSLRGKPRNDGPGSPLAAALDTARSSDFSATAALYGTSQRPGGPASPYANGGPGSSSRGRATLGGALPATTLTGTPRDSGVQYMYQTGPYTSKTGLPPLAFKPWLTEYIDEYRSPRDVKEALHTLTARYGTGDALRTSRYQHQGYPSTFNLLEGSLTRRGSKAPGYESRVTAF